MNYTIEVRSEHPLVDMTVTNGAQAIAEELGHEGGHGFSRSRSAPASRRSPAGSRTRPRTPS